jgi:hypothetical protein
MPNVKPKITWTLPHTGRFNFNNRNFTEVCVVTFADATWSIADVIKAQVPSIYDAHRDPDLAKLGYYVEDASFTRDKDVPQNCNITYSFTNILPQQGQLTLSKAHKFEPDPLKRPPTITLQTYKTREAFDLAYEKPNDSEPTVPIQTTAMEPIIYTRERSRRAITIQMNMETIPDIFFLETDVINGDKVDIPVSPLSKRKMITLDKGTLLLFDSTVSTEQEENGIRYFKVTTVLHHRKEGWNFKPRNVGRQAYSLIDVTLPNGQVIQKRTSTPSLIKIGSPIPELPINPLPLRNTPDDLKTHGLLFSDYVNYDPDTGQYTVDQDPVTPVRLKEIFKEATLDFQTYPTLSFMKYIPGLSYL